MHNSLNSILYYLTPTLKLMMYQQEALRAFQIKYEKYTK